MSLSGKPVVVLGMHRSGTSAVTNALARLGVFMGREADLVTADKNNEEGYWELNDVLQLNRQCLSSLDMAYDRVGPLPGNWLELPRTEALLRQLEAILTKHYAGHRRWGWKEPLTTVLLPFYNEAFRRLKLRPHYVLCVRNPLDVAASLAKRDKMREDLALGLWLRYTLAALKDGIGESRTVVPYHEFLADPKSALSPTVRLAGEWAPSDADWAAARATVRADLNHSHRPLEELNSRPSIIKRTFELCLAAAADPDGFQAGNFDQQIEGLWGEWRDWKSILREPDLPTGLFSVYWRQDARPMRSDCEYVPKGDWQTLTVPVSAPPGSQAGAVLYQLPSEIWIRKAIWNCHGKAVPAVLRPGSNATLDSDGGIQRLTVSLGPEQILVQVPNEPGPYEFELEILLSMNIPVALACLKRATVQLVAERQRAADLDRRCAELEMRLRNRQ